jgi:hypothetical protein
MNRVWISGRIVSAAQLQGDERVFVIQTLEAKPKQILTKYFGENDLAIDDMVESFGEIGDQEPVVVAGQQVLAVDGRVAMRNVYYAHAIYRLSVGTQNTKQHVSTPRSRIVSSTNRGSEARNRECDVNHQAKEVSNVRGPELPWEKCI